MTFLCPRIQVSWSTTLYFSADNYDCRLKEKFENKFGRDAIVKAEADVRPCLQNDYLTICEINADIDRCIMHAVMEGELYFVLLGVRKLHFASLTL